jgi:predicted nucleotidyltransferase
MAIRADNYWIADAGIIVSLKAMIDGAFRCEAKALCGLFGIRRLSVFGSTARGEQREDSDIDFLAEFESPTPATMPDRYFGFIEEAGKRFNRKIQLLTPSMIRNPHLRKSISRDLVVIHE